VPRIEGAGNDNASLGAVDASRLRARYRLAERAQRLATLPWALWRAVDLGDRGRLFYSAFGVVLCVVFTVTDYGAVSVRAASARH
jgi:hypothetical protein